MFEPFNYYIKKAVFLVNIGRLVLTSALGELPSEHAVFNIQLYYLNYKIFLHMTLYNFLLFYLTKKTIYILCIWPHIIFIILLIIGVWTISFSGKKKKRFTCDHTCKVCVIQSYLFWLTYNVNNMNTQIKEKVLARLGRLRLQGALVTAPERCV